LRYDPCNVEIVLGNDGAAEMVSVLLALADHLRSVDEPVSAFALRGVADSLARAMLQGEEQ
jgi:hypothetical protein